jgi:hypothetical protein
MKLSLVSDSLSHLSFDALLEFRKIGEGILADQSWPMAKALKEDGYESVISYESVYRPKGGRFEDGFHAAIGCLKTIFGGRRPLLLARAASVIGERQLRRGFLVSLHYEIGSCF